jgi:hypothetical protein
MSACTDADTSNPVLTNKHMRAQETANQQQTDSNTLQQSTANQQAAGKKQQPTSGSAAHTQPSSKDGNNTVI